MTESDTAPKIRVKDLTMAFGSRMIQKDLNFTVNRGDIFLIMGESGCGKSTLLRHMIGLLEPASGEILYDDQPFTRADADHRLTMLRRFGVLYQQGALWSGLTLSENVALPLEEFTDLPTRTIQEIATYKLSLVGLKGFESFYPSEISGGMRKRAGLARAMALDPEVLFFDEPSAGLDPVSSQQLDETILQLRDSLGATVVIVTHELSSIFGIGDRAVFLDAGQKTMTGLGSPQELLDNPPNASVHAFLTRKFTERMEDEK